MDSQERLTMVGRDQVAITTGALVIGAVLVLIMLKKLSVNVSL